MTERLSEATKLVARHSIVTQFRDRFFGLKRAAAGIGWGYGDNVGDLVDDLEVKMGEA